MKLILKKGTIADAPKGYVRVALTDAAKGTKRFVKEGETETLQIGIGKDALNQRQFIILCRAVVQSAKANKIKKLALELPDLDSARAQLAGENFEMANYEFNNFKTKPKEGWNDVEEIVLYCSDVKAVETAAKKGQEVGKAVNACRTVPVGRSMMARALFSCSESTASFRSLMWTNSGSGSMG